MVKLYKVAELNSVYGHEETSHTTSMKVEKNYWNKLYMCTSLFKRGTAWNKGEHKATTWSTYSFTLTGYSKSLLHNSIGDSNVNYK